MRVNVSVASTVKLSARMRQVCSAFDCPPSDKTARTWSGDVPIEDRDWSIGLIVGPSGCGKSTVARQMFGAEYRPAWDPGVATVDGFAKSLALDDITGACGAVGFNTIPAWLRPRDVLSNGEGFRVDLARALVEGGELVWVDEFTSVVDRQVAKIASHAVQRFVRGRRGRRFVAVGCHYDVIDWLQPDWILEPATMTFTWRSLQRRPSLAGVIRRAPHSLWEMFAPYHYMSASLNPSARCYALEIDDRPVAFAGVLPLPVSRGRDAGTAIYRISRVVVLPDWQGIGLVNRLSETLGAAYTAVGRRLRVYPAHPSLVNARLRKPSVWRLEKEPGRFASPSSSEVAGMGGRPCAVFEYIGPQLDVRAAQQLLAIG